MWTDSWVGDVPAAIAWAAALGVVAGALVALVARSLPERGRLVARPSCARCRLPLGWAAASSTLRLLGLGRTCPACHSGPSAGDVGLEMATALMFAALAARWPAGPVLAVHLGFAALLLAILAIDLRYREVYLVLGYGGIVLAVALSPLSMSGGLGSALLGGAVGTAAFGVLYVVGRLLYGGEPLGSGDVTIATLLGAMAGFPAVLSALLLGILAGGVGALAVLLRARDRRAVMPYGPALCLGGLLTMLAG